MTTEQAAKVLIPDQTKPAKTFTEDEYRQEVSKATSKFQKEASNANKQAKVLQAQMDDLRNKMAQAEEDARVARLAGDDEEEAVKVRERVRFEKVLDDRESRVVALERKHTMTFLAAQYGIPEEDLEEYTTAAEMEMVARDFRMKALEEENRTLKAAPKDEPPEPKKPGFDTGGGKSAPPPQDIMKLALSKDPKDQAKFEESVAAAMRRR